MTEIRNLAEALFRLEGSRSPADITQVLQALGAVLKGAEMQPLRRTITVWVRLLLRRKAPRANFEEIDSINDLLETHAMLEQTIERWFKEATMNGMRKGVQEGLTKAVALLIQMRFGPVPAWAQARLDEASEEQLIVWRGAILTAASLQDLFGSDGAFH